MDRALFGAILQVVMGRYFRRFWVFGAVGCAIGLLLLISNPTASQSR
jgi:hypothetical protein